jgi:uncharacterized Rossmann fold enzyme
MNYKKIIIPTNTFVKEIKQSNKESHTNLYGYPKNLYNNRIVEPIWKNQTCFIIGGGSSLEKFDFNLLKNKNIIAINKAFKYVPFASVLYWSDIRFYEWEKEEILKFKGLKYTNKPFPTENDIINLRDSGRDGLEKDPSALKHGNNSGYAAINLAYHLGCNRIILLGYDMKLINNKSHFHEGYKDTKQNNELYQSMKKSFPLLSKELEENHIKVINLNIDSDLDCFQKMDIGNIHLFL